MARKFLFIGLVGIVMSGILLSDLTAQAHPSASTVHAASPSCAQPSADSMPLCLEMERQILAATVRIELETWLVNEGESGYTTHHANGHATIREGRYLVTHNHYNIPLSIFPEAGGADASSTVTLYMANGQKILKAPLTDLSPIVVDAETLVLDVGEAYQERLAAFGVGSVEFKAWLSLPLQPGMEVGQIDWDGATASVDWVTIDAVFIENGTPRLELDNYIKIGASGGAVIWQGFHIANNWARVAEHDAASQYSRQFSVVALNSPEVAAVGAD